MFKIGNRNDEGTFTIWALCLCLMMFVIAGIAVDVWRAFDSRRTLADIADTAARSGASEINIFERQFNNRVVLDAQNATDASLESLALNSELKDIEITSANVEVDTTDNTVSIEITSEFSFFLLGFLPGATDAQIISRSSASPFEGS